jgi:hypothetical protein
MSISTQGAALLIEAGVLTHWSLEKTVRTSPGIFADGFIKGGRPFKEVLSPYQTARLNRPDRLINRNMSKSPT